MNALIRFYKAKFSLIVTLFFLILNISLNAQITWPQDQILPSFPRSAETQDLFYLRDNAAEEWYLLTSLKGIVNLTEPRMFVYDGDANAEGAYSWLTSLGLGWNEYRDNWDLVDKYKDEVEGLIVYDPNQIHTVNLATILAGQNNALIVSPNYLSTLTSAPYNFPVIEDLRNQFNSKLEVYQEIYDVYWPDLQHRILIGLHPNYHKGSLREYAIGTGSAVIWLDPEVSGESELLNNFLASMPDGANYMGWWPEEGPGVDRASNYGIPTIPSDYCSNLTVHSGMPRQINVKPAPPKPALKDKIYVAFVLSDGDNLQFVEHLLKKRWENPDRGTVPLGWTVSPAMVDAMPGALNYFHESATDNDNLVSGPSGYGYSYPNFFPDQAELNRFVETTGKYNREAGIRVITVWNTITGGIDLDVGQTYAELAPSTLGLTAQNTGGGLTIYNNSLPGMALTCNYCWNVENMLLHIGYGSEGWDGNSPRFLIIQCNPWEGASPTTFKEVAASLNLDYEVVRPDHIFQLMREANGLPINPSYPVSSTPSPSTGLVTAYTEAGHAGFSAGLQVGEYTLTDLERRGINDNTMASVKINPGYKIILYTDDEFAGNSTEFSSDVADLGTFKDNVSSLKVTTDGATDKSGTYILKNKASDLYLEVSGGTYSVQDGVNIRQYSLISKTNQQFKFTHLGNGSYQILAEHSDKSIDINGSDKSDGANVYQQSHTGIASQRFVLLPTEGNYYKIMALHSGKILVVENNTIGGNVYQTTDNNQEEGQWELLPPLEGSVGTGKGLTAEYYNGQDFNTLAYSTVDPNIDFNWGDDAPNSSVGTDDFSVRWTGYIQSRFSGSYKFYINSDNGRRLWINNHLIIDEWVDDYGVEYSASIFLSEGVKYEFKLEYFENFGGASCILEWESPYHSREVVPQSQFYTVETSDVSCVYGSEVEIYPNPTENKKVNVRIKELIGKEKALFSIYDVSGKLVFQKEVGGSEQVDLGDVSTGTYFVNIYSEEIDIDRKIVIL